MPNRWAELSSTTGQVCHNAPWKLMLQALFLQRGFNTRRDAMDTNCRKIHFPGKIQVSVDGLSAWWAPQSSSTIWALTENRLESFFPPSPSGNKIRKRVSMVTEMLKKYFHGNRGCFWRVFWAQSFPYCDPTANTELRNPWPTKKETSVGRY